VILIIERRHKSPANFHATVCRHDIVYIHRPSRPTVAIRSTVKPGGRP